MVLRLFFVAILAVFLLDACKSSSTKIEDKTSESDGFSQPSPQALYVLHCETCHGLDGQKGSSGAANLATSTLNDNAIKDVILNGNQKGMMPYKDIIKSDDQINALVDYVKTLRK
jgi:mono/diheme cytochrome c family protein